MSSTSSTGSLASAHDDHHHSGHQGQPKPYGIVHSFFQQVDSPVNDLVSLRQHLEEDDPLLNWLHTSNYSNRANTHESIDFADVKTWFPSDDQVAFCTPAGERDEYNTRAAKYHSLTYRELQDELASCPTFGEGVGGNALPRVAIVIPSDQMADMAMVLLSVIGNGATAVPLDPRMPAKRILEAMQQLECTSLVTTESLAVEREILEKKSVTASNADNSYYTIHESLIDNNLSTSENCNGYLRQNVKEIRLITSGLCGRVYWTCLSSTEENVWTPELKTPREKQTKPPPASKSPTSMMDSKFGNTCTWNAAESPSDNSTNKKTVDGTDIAMLLRTSGTTNVPKVVPITYSMLLYGAISIAAALELTREDCDANSMPFFHIGGISCNLFAVLLSGGSVLLAGPLQDPNVFLDHLIVGPEQARCKTELIPAPTWYYAGPSMHKAIILMAEARYNDPNNKQQPLCTHLRFLRSASAHLNHDLALRLSKVFACQVIPTFGMSEAMPICSSAPIDVRNNPPCQVIDSVGYPAGTSVRIADPETDKVLEYGSDQVGEICVKGAGVIYHYVGLDVAKTHTPDGWLRTGDHGMLDKQGRLFIKGRSKEMIKRGGEQVWPNEIDDVVEKVPGVATALAFGVPNELWGEEVAVAVVLQDSSKKSDPGFIKQMTDQIMETCQQNLDELSTPKQIKFLGSAEELLKGSTGKYIRSKMASHLNVTAVDTGALRVLTSVSQLHRQQNFDGAQPAASQTDSPSLSGKLGWLVSLINDLAVMEPHGHRVVPAEALNGVRFLVSCFVVMVHVGLFPNLTWIKLQGYAPNMMVFFSLAGFQTTCQVANSITGRWASFVGTKIGSLHSLFVISQLITFPSYVLFTAFDDNGNLQWGVMDWVRVVIRFVFSTATGLGHAGDVNMFAWFQSVFYVFLILFPFLDGYLRTQSLKKQGTLLVLFGLIASAFWALVYLFLPREFFWEEFYPIGWSIIAWLPLLITSMLMGYMFQRLAGYYWQKEQEQKATASDAENQENEEEPATISVADFMSQTRFWGIICDLCSCTLLLIWIYVALAPNCLCIYEETFLAMRPEDDLPEPGCRMTFGLDDYVRACSITYDEYMDYIRTDPNYFEFGRFVTMWSGGMGYGRIPAPLFALWVASMAFGQGYTARIFGSKFMTMLAPLGYPLYLMQMAVARYYWLATRGLERQDWWGKEGEFPFPVEWYEFFIILFTAALLGGVINTFVVPFLMPHSISLGVSICSWIQRWVCRIVSCCCCNAASNDSEVESGENDGKVNLAEQSTSSYQQVEKMVRGLTGAEVGPGLSLRHLGLDSLGAAALLGMLRSSVPAARKMTLRQLQDCDTIGDLATFLDGDNTSRNSSNGDDALANSTPRTAASTATSFE